MAITETILADVQVRGIDQFGQLRVSMDTVARSTNDAAKSMTTVRAKAAAAAKQLGVNTKIARRFVNTALNAGFAADEQAAAMEKIKEVAKKTGRPIEIIEKAWEGLARTLQDADQATENLEDALRFQARSGIPEAEKAAAKYAQTIGGGTDALKSLTGVGEMYAAQLDKIRDADLKAKLTSELARKELNRKRETLERVKDSYNALSLRMKAALGPTMVQGIKLAAKAIKLLAIAFAVTLAAAVAVAAKAIAAFLVKNKDTKKATDRLKKSIDDLQYALGESLAGGAKKAETQINDLTVKIRVLTTKLKENQTEINSLATDAVKALVFAGEAVLGMLSHFTLGFAIALDGIELGFSAFATVIIGLSTVIALGIGVVIDITKSLGRSVISIMDLVGKGDAVPDGLRRWVNSATQFKDAIKEAEEMLDPFLERMGEGFKRTKSVTEYTTKIQRLINKLKDLEARPGQFAAEDLLAASLAAAQDAKDTWKKPSALPTDESGWRAMPAAADGGSSPLISEGAGPLLPTKTGAWIGDGFNAAEFNEGLIKLSSGLEESVSIGETALGSLSGLMEDMQTPMERFWGSFGEHAKGAGLAMVQDFGGNVAKAFGASIASGESFNKALGDIIKATVAQAADSFGRYFVLQGTAISFDPLLGGPAIGIPLIAAGLGLQAFGGYMGSTGGGKGGGAATSSAAVSATAFLPRRPGEEEERTTIVNVTVAGDQIRDPIWNVVREGFRTGHLRQQTSRA